MQIRIVKPSSSEEKQTKTTVDTVEITEKLTASWRVPSFQRDLKVNSKVLAVAEEIKAAGGVLPGMLTIGVLDGITYIVDGQHRIAAWRHTGLPYGYADVRTHFFESTGDMAQEFVRLNSSLVRLRPDDILRGMEPSTPGLQRIRRKCGFIGYDMVRRSEKSPVLSMSSFVRMWDAGRLDVPAPKPTMTALASLDEPETTAAIEFASVCYEAWRRDPEYARLWSMLNLTLCAWTYRRVVMGERLSAQSRVHRLSKDDYRKCLLALSADSHYLEYLVGRVLTDRDRAACYNRIKVIFTRRYLQETGKAIKLPLPSWSHA